MLAPLALLGTFQTIREELSLEWQSRLQLFYFLPQWSWQTWLILILVVVVFIVLESAYRIVRNEHGEYRPKFTLKFKDEVPFWQINDALGWESYWVRVEVMNSGKSVAKGCRGEITRFMNSNGQNIAYDSLNLHWIQTPWEYPFREVPLRKKEKRYLDVLVQKFKSPSEAFLFEPSRLFRIDDLKSLPNDTSKIEITIYSESEDAEPCTKEFDIEWRDNTHSYKSLKLKESTSHKGDSQT